MEDANSQANRDERKKAGEFVRGISAVRRWLTPGGEFPPEPNRYHLIVAHNCPWCHRVILARAMLQLEDAISMDVCFPNRTKESDTFARQAGLWQFRPDGVDAPTERHISFPECTEDTVFGLKTVIEIYEALGVTNEKSVPLLIDKKRREAVSNESAEIVRMLGDFAADIRGQAPSHDVPQLYPQHLREKIDAVNERVYHEINNGAYRAGFSSNQDKYEDAHREIRLAWLKDHNLELADGSIE